MGGVSIFSVNWLYKRIPFGDVIGVYSYKVLTPVQSLIIKNETDQEILVKISSPTNENPTFADMKLTEILPGDSFSTELYFGRVQVPLNSIIKIEYLNGNATTGQVKLSGFNG